MLDRVARPRSPPPYSYSRRDSDDVLEDGLLRNGYSGASEDIGVDEEKTKAAYPLAHSIQLPHTRRQEKTGFTIAFDFLFSFGMRPRAGSVRLPMYENGGGIASSSSRVTSSGSLGSLVGGNSSSSSRSPSRSTKLRRKRSLIWQTKYSSFWRPRTLYQLVRLMLTVAAVAILVIYWVWEPHIEITFYSRNWVHREIKTLEPLAGCFDKARISPKYNVTAAFAPKRYEVQAGLPLRLGMDCYDFAATIQPLAHSVSSNEVPTEPINYHTYWRADLVPFGDRQEWMVKSFFATQDLARSRLILWSNGDLRGNERVRRWLRRFPDSFQQRIVDVEALAKGTALEGSELLYAKDSKAWVDGDLVRLLVTWAFGGVWVDMDSLLTRDLAPLLEHEFVTQWDCYDKIYQPFNGAVMHFLQHSAYLCEAFEIMSHSPPPRSGTTEWGSLLYLKLWRRLVASGVPPFKVLPFCFTDARSCRLDNRLPDPFVKDRGTWADGLGMHEGGPLDATLGKIFSVHLHNQWQKAFPRGGWVERLLLKRYNRALGVESLHVDEP